MYRTLLVPLDGSPFAEHALPLALTVARHAGASLKLVNVVTPLTEAYAEGIYALPADLQAEVVRQQKAYLDGVVGRVRARVSVPVSAVVLEGEVASSLRAHAEAVKADLVVMATHGRGAFGRFWLGSVADELVRELHLPLLLARPEEAAVDLAHEPDLGRVLLPLDGTALAESAIEPAVALAALLPDAEVLLLRVIKPAPTFYEPLAGASADEEACSLVRKVEAMQRDLYDEAGDYLARVATRLRGRGLRVRARVDVEGQAAIAILNAAGEEHTDLIALATHGRRGLSRLMLGSVADKVIRGAHGPVLVLRPVKT